MELFEKINKIQKKLKIPVTSGICVLFVEKTIDSLLCITDKFVAERVMPWLNISFFSKKSYLKNKLGTFVIHGTVYQDPQHYKDLLAKPLTNFKASEISPYIQPSLLEDLGGRYLLKSFIGIYFDHELSEYVELMHKLALTTPHNFIVSISSHNHKIAVFYLKAKNKWYLINNARILNLISKDVMIYFLKQALAVGIAESENNSSTAMLLNIYTIKKYKEEMLAWLSRQENQSEFKSIKKKIFSRRNCILRGNFKLAHWAAIVDDIDILNKLLKHDPKLLTEDETNSYSPLFFAISFGNFNLVRFFINSNLIFKKHLTNSENMSIFHVASLYGQDEMLIYFSSLYNISDYLMMSNDEGKTPIALAIENNHYTTFELLIALSQESYYFISNKEGYTPFLLAILYNNIEVVNALLALQDRSGKLLVEVNEKNAEGESAIFIAAQEGNVDSLKKLLSAKHLDGSWRADINLSDNEGRTPLFIAVANEDIEVLTVLLQAKHDDNTFRADINLSMNYYFSTPLHIAVLRNNFDIVRLLLSSIDTEGKLRADLTLRDRQGFTPIDLAVQANNAPILDYLFSIKNEEDLNSHSSLRFSCP